MGARAGGRAGAPLSLVRVACCLLLSVYLSPSLIPLSLSLSLSLSFHSFADIPSHSVCVRIYLGSCSAEVRSGRGPAGRQTHAGVARCGHVFFSLPPSVAGVHALRESEVSRVCAGRHNRHTERHTDMRLRESVCHRREKRRVSERTAGPGVSLHPSSLQIQVE